MPGILMSLMIYVIGGLGDTAERFFSAVTGVRSHRGQP